MEATMKIGITIKLGVCAIDEIKEKIIAEWLTAAGDFDSWINQS